MSSLTDDEESNDDEEDVMLIIFSMGTPAANMGSNMFILIKEARARTFMDVSEVVAASSIKVVSSVLEELSPFCCCCCCCRMVGVDESSE